MPQLAEQITTTIEPVLAIATRKDFVAECRKFLGVRWQHQGRSEKGIDCVGLLVAPAMTLGVLQPEDNVANYHRMPQDDTLDKLLHRHCRRLPKWKEAQPADILAVKYDTQPQHVMIITKPWNPQWGFHVIHSFGNAELGGAVIEHRLDTAWLDSHRARIHAAFTIRGVA